MMPEIKKLKEQNEEDFFVAKCIGTAEKMQWSPWLLTEDWQREYPSQEPSHRQILPNEVVIETDMTKEENEKISEEIRKRLREGGIGYECWFSGNKSFHTHIFFNKKLRKEEKEQWTKHILPIHYEKIDKSNLGEKHLILIPNAINPKSNKPKILIEKTEPTINEFPLLTIQEQIEMQEGIRLKCELMNYALENKLPEGERNQVVCPNFIALNPPPEQIAKFVQAQKMNEQEVVGWEKSKAFSRVFNCIQLQKYAKNNNLEQLCQKCIDNANILEVTATIQENFPNIELEAKACLSIVSTILLNDLCDPMGLILVGAPSSEKTTTLSFFYGLDEIIFKSDNFSPKSFVSHAVTQKESELQKIDLLPKIRHKCLLVPELAPIFGKRRDDLVENVSILTRVFDGEGFESDSGLRGHRGYTGEYLFTMLAATTPMSRQVWETIGKLGNRWLFLNMSIRKKDDAQLIDNITGKKTFKQKQRECREVIHRYLRNLFKRHRGFLQLKWDREGDNIDCLVKIIKLTELIRKLRAPLEIYEETDEITGKKYYSYSSPLIEEPERLNNLFYNLARGHAIINNRSRITEDDMDLVYRAGLSSMPYERSQVFALLVENAGSLDVYTISNKLKCSIKTAHLVMKCFEILGVVEARLETEMQGTYDLKGRPKKYIVLKEEFEWIIEERYKLILQTFLH